MPRPIPKQAGPPTRGRPGRQVAGLACLTASAGLRLRRLGGLLSFLLFCTMLVPGAGVAQGAGQEITVIITVTDRLSQAPVRGAVITLTPLSARGEPQGAGRVYATDEDGRARSQPMAPGDYLLDARAAGYRALEERLRIEGPPPVTLTIQLAPDVMEVEGVAATAQRNPYLERGGFYERQVQGQGVTFTRQQLEQLGVFQTTDVFRGLAGVTLDYGGSPTSPFLRFRQGCRPDVVMDGANLGPDVRLDDLVSPSTIEGLEVYRGATVPNTLSDNPCGAVLVWTLSDQPEGARPLSWGRIIFGVVVITVAQLLSP